MSNDPFREKLSDAEYHVLREGGTERPYTGEYWDTKDQGIYYCRACGTELFRSETKFDSRCGWPSFFKPEDESKITYLRDGSLGMQRTEVRCANCDSHLGHVFEGEGFDTPTDLRYCINSLSMSFDPASEADDSAESKR